MARTVAAGRDRCSHASVGQDDAVTYAMVHETAADARDRIPARMEVLQP
jgi:hypothetical protein